ncbi:restriction endonuclease [Amycolatopsis aidingensis]|uniref:restriction endonuclease n=1 Tax=Amycolatopsis aidingensis TaxID=2842453 RepID=UPI001C0C30AB
MEILIEGTPPADWKDLESRAAQILQESGWQAERGKSLQLARGSVDVDVYAFDPKSSPPATMIVECKNWRSRVSKNTVHGLRTVVADTGANIGILVSSSGFSREHQKPPCIAISNSSHGTSFSICLWSAGITNTCFQQFGLNQKRLSTIQSQ